MVVFTEFTPPCRTASEIIGNVVFSAFTAIAFVGIIFLFMNAADRETEFKNERLCRYHAAEINQYAIEHGKEPPCLN